MSFDKVRELLYQQLNTVANANNILVAWENVSFDKNTTTNFIEPYFLPATPDTNLLSGGSRLMGVLHINVYTEKNQGYASSSFIIKTLEDYFLDKRFLGLNYTLSIDDVYIENTTEKIVNDKFREIVVIGWTAWR